MKAVITAAGKNHRHLPLQTMADETGMPRSILSMQLRELRESGIEKVGIIINPGDEALYREATGDFGDFVHCLPQDKPRGYAYAILCAEAFVGEAPFLLSVADHLFVGARDRSLFEACAALSDHELLLECEALDKFWPQSDNLYERVRALMFLHALHRFVLPERGLCPGYDPVPQKPVEHWYELPGLLLNGTLRQLIEARPALRTLLLHNIDTLGAVPDPELLGRHRQTGHVLDFELISRRFDDLPTGYFHVDRLRGQQLKDPAQLDAWSRDGSHAHIADLCDFGGQRVTEKI